MEAALNDMVDFHRRWALLATCHRVELYGFGPGPSRSDMRLLEGEAAAAVGGVVTVAGRRLERAAIDLRAAAHRASDMAAVAVALRGEWVELAAAVQAVPDRRLPPLADLSAPPAVPARVRLALGPD